MSSEQGRDPAPVTVVYMACDANIKGGWADRLYGMIALYKICKLCGFRFKIRFTVPFDLSDYLRPRYDWKISDDEIVRAETNGVTVSSFATDIDLPEYNDTVQYHNVDFHGLCAAIKKISLRYEYIFCYTNRRYPGSDYETLFNELFTLSPELSSAVGYHRAKMNGGYAAAAFRFQALLGDFKENEARRDLPVLPAGLQDVLIRRNIGHLIRIRDANKGKKILVCSDSEKFRNAAAAYDFVYAIGGKRMHLDVLKMEERYATLTLIDFFMISYSDIAYLVLGGLKHRGVRYEMYNSGFPRLAAQIAGKKIVLRDYRSAAAKLKRYAAGFWRRIPRPFMSA